MLKKIILRNFQIHKKLIYIFDEHFNIIWGPNDRGKSSVIRALYWILYNSPSGDWMRRNVNGKLQKTTVEIVLSSKDIIKRIKGDGINRYKLNKRSFNESGRQVPEPILEVLKINQLKVGNIKLHPHVGMHGDSMFLVADSSTVKASVINMLTGAELIQNAIKDFNKEKLAANREIKSSDEDVKDLKKSIKKLKYLTDFDKKFVKTVEKSKKLDEKYKKLEKIILLEEQIRKWEKISHYKIPDILIIENNFDRLCGLYNMLVLIKEILVVLEGMHDLDTDIKNYKKELDKIKVCPKCGRPL